MHFITVAELFGAVRANLHKLPKEVDVVVGIPRSGMIAATAVSLALHKPMTSLDAFLEGRKGSNFSARIIDADAFNSALVVDDSIFEGGAMKQAREAVAASPLRDAPIHFAAVYGHKKAHPEADVVLTNCPIPRVFEWNVMNHWSLMRACVDLDGVLCADPCLADNDDGPRYLDFLRSAPAINPPPQIIHSIVTSRLERYRPETEDWLKRNGFQYRNLFMLDLPSAEERRRQGVHADFKAAVYARQADCLLFIESETWQAQRIHEKTGKSALAYKDMTFFPASTPMVRQVRRKLGSILGRLNLRSA